MTAIDFEIVERTRAAAVERLRMARTVVGSWLGELSSSALSTATATCAIALSNRDGPDHRAAELVRKGLNWLAENRNADGGWGDTVDSPSNISTTTLAWAAFGATDESEGTQRPIVTGAEDWLKGRIGGLSSEQIAQAIGSAYGSDRTFSTPILTMCALAGCLGKGPAAWRYVPALPFELAALPHSWFRRLGLPVVSYALPALIAIGQVRQFHYPTRNPLSGFLRTITKRRTLDVLEQIQPESGGYLEAAPLTSFVVMSLVSMGLRDHPVVNRGLEFLAETVRADGSWPIDTSLDTWTTTLAINALAAGGHLADRLSMDERSRSVRWLLAQQYQREHPYTHAAPGGWAWTDLSGGVPDADDTAGALLALWNCGQMRDCNAELAGRIKSAAIAGIGWLLDLQNRDGGLPTFCRGWGRLPFDRSSPDLTAHTLRAWYVWRPVVENALQRRIDRGADKALRYLLASQRPEGCWLPLWFGNQSGKYLENPLYGTTRVLRAGECVELDRRAWSLALARGREWVRRAQNEDGGWGGTFGAPSSIEETALALETLPDAAHENDVESGTAITRGCAWLAKQTGRGQNFIPTPIGLYFAKLWYAERLYPLLFTVGALERVMSKLVPH